MLKKYGLDLRIFGDIFATLIRGKLKFANTVLYSDCKDKDNIIVTHIYIYRGILGVFIEL